MLFRIIEQENIHFIQNKYDKGITSFCQSDLILINSFRKKSARITR